MYTKCNLSNAMKNLYMKLICNKNLCAFYMNAVFFLNPVDVLVHEDDSWLSKCPQCAELKSRQTMATLKNLNKFTFKGRDVTRTSKAKRIKISCVLQQNLPTYSMFTLPLFLCGGKRNVIFSDFMLFWWTRRVLIDMKVSSARKSLQNRTMYCVRGD